MNILRNIGSHKYLVAIIGGLLILALITGGVIFKNSQNETGSVSNDQVEINSDDNVPLATESAKETSEKESEKESTSVDSTGETSTNNQSSGSNTDSSQPKTQEEELEVIPPPPPPPPPPTVTISGSGFSPSSITINAGDTVVWVNTDSKAHEPASNNHPSHKIYSAFDSDPGIDAGSSWSFKFNNTGTWNYHDHRFPSKTGVVVVQ